MYEIGDDVKFFTEGGIEKTGTISSIFHGKYYVIPDGAENSILIKKITEVIPTKYIGKKTVKLIPTEEEYINNNLRTSTLSEDQLKEAYRLYYKRR